MAQHSIEEVFQLPARELKALSFCRADKVSMEQWVNSLPAADMAKSTRYLYQAIQEVGALKTSAATRMELLDVLRPSIHLALNGLRKSYLNQHIILPEQPRKIAALCHRLQMHLAQAYIIVACQSSEKMGSIIKKPTALMSRAIFQALQENTDILIRNYQLYKPDAERFWKNNHRLYQLALKYKLQKLPQANATDQQASSIEHAYMQLLLWGCIKANQLRQDDISRLEAPMAGWARLVNFCAVDPNQESAFIIDPKTDLPPIYRKFYNGKLDNHCLSLDTKDLIENLKENSSPLVQKKTGLSQNLINHLILAWGVFTGRTFMRLESNSQLVLSVGLTATHFFLSEQKPFSVIIHGAQGEGVNSVSQFTEQHRRADLLDAWDQSLFGEGVRADAQVTMESIDYHIRTGGNSMMTFTGSDKEKYQSYQVNVVNMSPSGYCLSWDNSAPAAIRAGELIGIKEDHHNNWNIGVIRWVRQNVEKSLQIGVELLSPKAEAYAACVCDYEGKAQSDFMRTIMLPEIVTAGQSRSVITPAVTFKIGQYVQLAKEGKHAFIQLKKLISTTGSYSQFTYESVKPLARTIPSDKMFDRDTKDSDIDNVWDLLK